ncbi:glycosyltransferase [Fictibacillus sp. b24]|uniref:glycosyltransferase n=1 Tax=Fictibacillus sp. b24 TaxID=3055863 RepID=UPI0025A075CB|nr:glycosyltransferase [Fictibacillus sp. b24]MDM5316397.1 glycosyltransferase [Fictibacillus sp. b24]
MRDTNIKVLFFTPYYYQNRGNATTARRIEHGLSREGEVEMNIFSYEEMSYDSVVRERMEKADVFHILHFARFVKWAERNQVELDKPYIVTSGGTDLNHSLIENEQRYLPLLKKAKAVTVFTQDAKWMLVNQYGLNDDFVHVIPQSVYLPAHDRSSEPLPLPIGTPKLLLPAGLRPVKDVLYALKSILKLKLDFPEITLLIAGANLDHDVYTQVQVAVEKYEWLHYLPEIDLSRMKELYEWTGLVLNTSFTEGQSTSLLEAMSLHKPVIARSNTGNCSIIRHNENGMLFQNHEELYQSLKKVLLDEKFYKHQCANGYQTIIENHTIEKEVVSYLNLYKI